jgi:hypothetical protein
MKHTKHKNDEKKKYLNNFLRIKVVTQVNIKAMVDWDVTPYCLVDRCHCATGTSWLLVL